VIPPLPQNLDEAVAWFGKVPPDAWSNFRLGLLTVVVLVVIVGVIVGGLVWLVRAAGRR
jgi:hypothetical protein